MNIKRSLNIFFLMAGMFLLAACSTTSSSPQPNKKVNEPTPLESSDPSETKITASDGARFDEFGRSVFYKR